MNFITCVLEENSIGAFYDGIIYDRWLKLRCQDGTILTVFDYADPVSTELIVGNQYDFVTKAALPTSLQYSETAFSLPDLTTW